MLTNMYQAFYLLLNSSQIFNEVFKQNKHTLSQI